jgi:hypothetical protein
LPAVTTSGNSSWRAIVWSRSRNEVPRRMFRRGFLHHVLDCRLVVRPAGVIAEILIGQFPALHRIDEPVAEAAYLLVGRDV